MVGQNLEAKQIKGLVPSLEGKQLNQPFVLYGPSKNFLLDLKGPYSAWSNQILVYDQIQFPELTQTFRVLEDDFIFTLGCVLRYDSASGRYYAVFTFTDNGLQWPWTSAEVAGKYYFCRRGAGLFKYDPTACTWETLTLNVPTNPTSIASSQGRLICMGDNQTSWSSLDDGTDFAPSLTTGAGFQGLSLVGGRGFPLGVLETSDGWINYTTKGNFKSELTNGPNPFRHYVLPGSKSTIPINQFCFVNDDNKNNIVLDRKGLYASNGGPFTPYEQVMGEFFAHDFITPEMTDPNFPTLLRMWFNENNKFLIISVANTAAPTVYNQAFVLYLPKDEWGSFDRAHVSFAEIQVSGQASEGFNFGYFDVEGYFHKFISDTFNEVVPTYSDFATFWQPAFTLPSSGQYIDTDANITWIFSSLIKMADLDETSFNNLSPGYYTINADLSYTLYVAVNSPLDSLIQVGLFRFQEQKYDDELSLVTNVAIGVDAVPGDPIFEDYNTESDIVEDWGDAGIVTTFEDWGFGFVQVTSFSAAIIGTLDGQTQWQDQRADLILETNGGSKQYFSGTATGAYHILEMSALNVNETFHLKSLDISGSLAGRL